MLSIVEAQDRAAALVAAAMAAGADAADALYLAEGSTGIQVRLGALEDVERSEGEAIGLRFFIGSRSASVSSSDLSREALESLVDRAGAMATQAPEDRLMKAAGPDIDGDDGADPPPTSLKERALAMEEVARSVPGVSNSEGASVSAGRSVAALATSHGFCRGYTTSGYSAGVSVIVGEGGGMQRDSAHHAVRHFADLDGPETLGSLAATRAVARLNPTRPASGTMPVVFDPRVGSSLVGHFLGAISGPSVTRGTSFLLGREDEAIFAEQIVIRDDPHRPRGLRSRPFDGEGVATQARDLVAAGRSTGWLLDSASARQLGLEPTGHAVRGASGAPSVGATNVDLLPGTLSKDALIADIARGIYVIELIGQGVNPVTGDYSRGAAGFLIENGKITTPVAEITIAGNLIEMFRQLTAANDLEQRRAMNVPTLRVEGMMIAGA